MSATRVYCVHMWVCVGVWCLCVKATQDQEVSYSITYSLLLRIHISDAKVVPLQEIVVIADMIQQELTFSLPLKEEKNGQNLIPMSSLISPI